MRDQTVTGAQGLAVVKIPENPRQPNGLQNFQADFQNSQSKNPREILVKSSKNPAAKQGLRNQLDRLGPLPKLMRTGTHWTCKAISLDAIFPFRLCRQPLIARIPKRWSVECGLVEVWISPNSIHQLATAPH